MSGEELFSSTASCDEEVWYDVYSFSLRATLLVRLIAPIALREAEAVRASVAGKSGALGRSIIEAGNLQ